MKLRTVSLLGAIASLAFVLSMAQAAEKAEKPDARLKLSTGSVAAGVGFSWGGGTLTYQGKSHDVEVSGLSVGDVGASKIEAVGEVFHLKKLAEVDGTYTAAAAAATVGGGAGTTVMQNQNGVTIHMTSTSQGLKFTLAAAGVSLKIKK